MQHFLMELWHLVEAAFGNQHALQALVESIGYRSDKPVTSLDETVIMLVVLALTVRSKVTSRTRRDT